MPVSVTMPRLGESVTEGTVTRWLKKEGERVEADEPLLEVSTDKVDTEIPSPAAGVLTTIRVGEDETVEVGVELATIDESDDAAGGGEPAAAEPDAEQAEPEQAESERADQSPTETQPDSQPATQPEMQPVAAAAPPPQPAAGPPASRSTPVADPSPALAVAEQPAESDEDTAGAYVTPLVRKLAAEHAVDLSSVTGTGVGGRIRKQDVMTAARALQPAQPPAGQQAEAAPARSAPAGSRPAAAAVRPAASTLRGTTEKMSRLRSVIAHRMVESLQISAQLTTVVEADVTKIARLRAAARDDFAAREGVRLSFLPFFALATVEALKQHPKLNASIDPDAGTVTYHDAEHLVVAVETERGLLVPVIHHAGDLNLAGLARKIADLAARTRDNRISPDELSGGTFTLTNTGSRGALFDTPIINQPQVAILGTGVVVKRPVVVDDPNLGEVISVRSMVYLALTYDHRIVDGADAARFLTTTKERLEGGQFETELGHG